MLTSKTKRVQSVAIALMRKEKDESERRPLVLKSIRLYVDDLEFFLKFCRQSSHMNPGFLIRTATHEMRKFIERNGGQYISPHCMVPTAEAISTGWYHPTKKKGRNQSNFSCIWPLLTTKKTTRKGLACEDVQSRQYRVV